ncbi:MAG TPA: M48 family metallopeptidase [Acidimicrobiales bacterium]|nr:M48 family metallopeptidase [Acidimicrobiales bacterium]
MALELSARYDQISPKSYEHPADRAATAALRSIPLMDTVIKRLVGIGHERRLRQVLIGNAVQVSDQQVPMLWARHCQAASVLDIARTPELFITQTPLANALTVGAKRPMVIIYSGLVKDYPNDEVDVVLAHEIGHVLSEHNYYQTALWFLTLLIASTSGLGGAFAGVPLRAIYLVLLEWSRAAELSADRASALVVGDPLATCKMLMRMAGGAVDGMSLDAFLAQAARYADEEDVLARWSRAWVEAYLSHPFAVKRTRELMNWVSDGSYDRIRGGAYIRRGQEPAATAEFQGAVAHYRERFVRVLSTATGGLERALRQLEDWLRPGGRGSEAGGGASDDGLDDEDGFDETADFPDGSES